MSKHSKHVLILVGFVVAIGVGLLIRSAIENAQYEKAKVYNTAIQADTTEVFNYAVDSRQGNVLASGVFTTKKPVSIEQVSGKYIRIVQTKERYTQHTETYQCGTEESPRTCTRNYYTWDYNGQKEYNTVTVTFHDRDYPAELFSIETTHRLDCDSIVNNCQYGYEYEDSSFWTSEGDLRWSYSVVNESVFGTILTNTKDGILTPIKGYKIDVTYSDIPTILERMNSQKLTPEVALENLDRKTATAYISSLKLKGYLEPTGRFGSYKIVVDN